MNQSTRTALMQILGASAVFGAAAGTFPWQERAPLVSGADRLAAEPARSPTGGGLDDYWYQGKAEVAVYDAQRSRYGQMRDAQSVLVFVSEDFLARVMSSGALRTADLVDYWNRSSNRHAEERAQLGLPELR